MPTLAADLSVEQARRVASRIQRDPKWFCQEVLGVSPYDKQIEMIESVRDHEQTTVVGANAVGKDWMVGRIICWWQASRYPAKTIITGPTARQVSDIVWRETRAAYYAARIPLGGMMLPVESRWVWPEDEHHFALGFSTDKAWNLTGFHSPNLLVVVTEAHNFNDSHLTSLKRLFPNRLLLTGNPFSSSGEFFDSHHDKRHLYNAIAISAYDTPNVKNGTDELPGVVTQRDIDKMKADWGEESPLYQATVDGKFAQTADGLIALSWLMRSQEPSETEDDAGVLDAGIDVAGPGEDETVLTIVSGPDVIFHKGWQTREGQDWGHVAAELLPYKARLRHVNVDSIGVGWGLYLQLKALGYKSVPVNVGEAARDTDKYKNLKAELYWGLRQRFIDGDVRNLPAEAVGQLAGLRYSHNSRGQVEIESKDEARKRGVKSPDKAESIMLAFAKTKKGGFEFV